MCWLMRATPSSTLCPRCCVQLVLLLVCLCVNVHVRYRTRALWRLGRDWEGCMGRLGCASDFPFTRPALIVRIVWRGRREFVERCSEHSG